MVEFEQLVQRLVDHQVEFVLVGGLAAAAHGITMVTRDIDVCCPFDYPNLQKLYNAISDLHPVHRETPQKLPLNLTPELCARLKNLYLITDAGALDCLGEIKGIGDFSKVNELSISVNLFGRPCRILRIEALIQAKEAMGRTQDKLAVVQLKAIQERIRGQL